MRRLHKLKVDGSDVLVKYASGESDEQMETITLEASEPPLPALKAALQALAVHLVALCEAPKGWADETEIRGVSLSDSDGVRGVTITGLRRLKLQNTPLVLNSPHATDCARSEDDKSMKGLMPIGLVAAIEALELEVWKYVDGEREQLALPFSVIDKAG